MDRAGFCPIETMKNCGVGISVSLATWGVPYMSITWLWLQFRLKAIAAPLDPMTVTVKMTAIIIAKRCTVSFPPPLDDFNCF